MLFLSTISVSSYNIVSLYELHSRKIFAIQAGFIGSVLLALCSTKKEILIHVSRQFKIFFYVTSKAFHILLLAHLFSYRPQFLIIFCNVELAELSLQAILCNLDQFRLKFI
jgi:hypothetical protein